MKKKWLPIIFIYVLFVGLLSEAKGQDGGEEVYLQFRYEGVVNVYVSTIYENEEFFVSVNDLFQSLEIDLNVNRAQFLLSGNYLGKGEYQLDFSSQRVRFKDQALTLSVDDFMITEFGYYLKQDLYQELFGLEVLINFNSLTMTIDTEDTMPVVARREREIRRQRALRNQSAIRQDFYPLLFDREQHVLNGSFLDYNLTANFNGPGFSSFLFNNRIGTEILYGDVQGTIYGSISEENSLIRSNNLRWKYGIRDKDWISTVTLGQSSSRGLRPTAYSGISITNSPLEPRVIYDETTISGVADPGSEVEIYRNSSLIDFTRAPETGEYSFDIPITYGSMTYRIDTYSPTGESATRELRLQIPQSFLPPGEINYTFNAGIMDNPIIGSDTESKMAVLKTDFGINDKVTFSSGVEYFEDYHDNLPTFSGKLSARVFESYLLSLEAANDAYYRVMGSVIYPNNMSISTDYTYYNSDTGIFNNFGLKSSTRVNIFTPIELGPVPLFFRWSVSNDQNETSSNTRYRFNMNTRVGRANLRMGFSDSQTGKLALETSPAAQFTGSITYSTPRSTTIPTYLRGLFLRVQTNYFLQNRDFENIQFSLSRSITRRGQLQFIGTHNFNRNFSIFRLAFSFDFDNFRSQNNVRLNSNNFTMTTGIRGSTGYDFNNNNMLFTNRQQVGRSAVAVRMFVDENDTGSYEEGEQIIPENAVRVERAGGIYDSKNGISYISQLQSFRRYNMTINKGLINNPLLVPDLEKFSIVTDPNQYKLIEVPFYMSGLIDGIVNRELENGSKSGIGGLRLYLQQVNVPEGKEAYSEEILTFSNGGFYSYEIPPGDYTLTVDPQQLEFLNRKSVPEKLEFTIEATSQGDFVEGLEIVLVMEQDSVGGNDNRNQQNNDDSPVEPDDIDEEQENEQSNIDVPVSRFDLESCTYLWPVGNFENEEQLRNYIFENDLRGASLALMETQEGYELWFFSKNSLTVILDGLDNDSEDSTVLRNCITNFEDPNNSTELIFGYALQFAALSDSSSAVEYSKEVYRSLNITTSVTYDEELNLYAVRSNPVKEGRNAYSRQNEILESGEVQDVMVKEVTTLITELNFQNANHYRVLAGQAVNRSDGIEKGETITKELSVETELIIDKSEAYIVGLQKKYSDRESAQADLMLLHDLGYQNARIIGVIK